jgi:hypothetical protein
MCFYECAFESSKKITNCSLYLIEYYWIGLTDAQEENIWLWISNGNKLVDGGYVNWASGEPTNSGCDENCVNLLSSGFWNDYQCHANAQYICEADNR